jgi:hypothetical protein
VKFELRRARPAELLALISAIVLALALFLPWYSVGGVRRDAFQTLTATQWLLAAAALVALALFITTVAQRSPALPVAMAVWTTLAGLIATVLVVVRAVALPSGATDRCYGLWVALAAAAALALAGALSMHDERPFWGQPAGGGAPQ